MKMTVEIHIDSQGFTWKFFKPESGSVIAEWSMKRDEQGGFTGTQKGDLTEALLTAQEKLGVDLEPLLEKMEYDEESTNPCDVCNGLRDLEES